MDKLNELTEYLGLVCGADYWSEEAIDWAQDLLNQLGAEQWNELFADWASHDVMWQVRLADALCTCESPRAIDLLLAMLRSNVLDVAVAAAESLEGKDDVWEPDPSMRSLLQDLHDRVEDEDKYIFAILLAKIPR
jgi:hypothetical protein